MDRSSLLAAGLSSAFGVALLAWASFHSESGLDLDGLGLLLTYLDPEVAWYHVAFEPKGQTVNGLGLDVSERNLYGWVRACALPEYDSRTEPRERIPKLIARESTYGPIVVDGLWFELPGANEASGGFFELFREELERARAFEREQLGTEIVLR